MEWRNVAISAGLGLRVALITSITLRHRFRDKLADFADDNFKCIFVNEDIWISINIYRKFVPNGPFNRTHYENSLWRLQYGLKTNRCTIEYPVGPVLCPDSKVATCKTGVAVWVRCSVVCELCRLKIYFRANFAGLVATLPLGWSVMTKYRGCGLSVVTLESWKAFDNTRRAP